MNAGVTGAAPQARVIATIDGLREALDGERARGRRVGFVPTMGYLHDGHRSLMSAAVAATDVVVVSVFVNPLQFAPTDDLARYPRSLEADVAMAASEGVAYVFAPSVDEMYPEPMQTVVRVAGVSEPLEGAHRPGHFDGVATVVTKLFAIVGPCRAFFGEKDAQQLAVVRRMVRDLALPITIVGCPTVREPDGLARSSRNVYLSAAERAAAPAVHRALVAGRDALLDGERDPAAVRAAMQAVIAHVPDTTVDYLDVVDPATFRTPARLAGSLLLLAAVRFPSARLIDNITVTLPPEDVR